MICYLNTSPAWATEVALGYSLQTAVATHGAIGSFAVGAKNYIVSIDGQGASTLTTRVFGARAFIPKTKLGAALWEARKRIVANREPLVPAKKLIADLAALRSS